MDMESSFAQKNQVVLKKKAQQNANLFKYAEPG
jgi:hypothetical protein